MLLTVIIASLITNTAPSNKTFDIDMSIGYSAACAVEDFDAYCWGDNAYGQLGTGNWGDEDKPPDHAISLGTDFDVASVSAGYQHTCAVSTDGYVKCWGHGGSGRCGAGNSDNVGYTEASMSNLKVIELGTDWAADQVAAGDSHTCALSLTTHEVKCWGYYYWGALGTGSISESVGDNANEMGDYLVAADLGVDFYPIQVAYTFFVHIMLNAITIRE